MATHRASILWSGFQPDDSGNVFVEGANAKNSNDFNNANVVILNDTATRIGFSVRFPVPKDYAGSPKFVIQWYSEATAGDVENDVDYVNVAPGETMDPAAAQASINNNDTAEGTARDMAENEISATAAHFTAGDICMANIYRDGTDAGDTLADEQIISDVLFEYSDS